MLGSTDNDHGKYRYYIIYIFNSDNLNVLFKIQSTYFAEYSYIKSNLIFKKIADNLFTYKFDKYGEDDSCLFYYDDKENRIKKCGDIYDGQNNLNLILYNLYFYLNNDMAGISTPDSFYIIDMSSNKIIRKFRIPYPCIFEIKYQYHNFNKKEYLYSLGVKGSNVSIFIYEIEH